jgi:outer membrane protein TolC
MSRRPRRRRGALIAAVLLLLPVSTAFSEVLPEAEADRLVKEALERSPELRAARDTAAAAAERVRPAGALPDPMVSLSYENDGVSPSLGEMEMTRLSLMVEQQLPFPGKLRLAEKIASKDAERAATGPDRAALALTAAVRRAYAALLEARENLVIVDEQIATFTGIEEVTRARYSAGLATQQDVLRAQAERTRLAQQRESDRAAEETSLSEIRQLLFRSAGTPLSTEARLVPGRLLALPSSDEARKRALETTPELREAALAKERGELGTDLARRNLKPDFVASAAYMNRGGLPLMWSASVGVTVPLWAGKKQRPLIVEAERLASSAAATEESLRRRVEALTEERLIRLNQITREARLDAEGVLVQDRLSVDAALASYRTGTVPFVTVLEALGTYFVDRRSAVGRLAGLLRARADLDELSLERTSGGMPPATQAGASAASSSASKM